METFTLKAELRSKTERISSLKNDKKLAWVVYGKTKESTSLKMDYSEFLKTFRKAWESHIISLQLWKDKIDVLVHDVQKQPVTGDFTHIDFYAITKWEKVHTKIPLIQVWESKAVKEWNIIEDHMKDIEIKCLPTDLVDNFEVDITKLENTWDTIRVSDLDIASDKYDILSNTDDIVVIAVKPAKVQIEEPVNSEEQNASTEETTEEK